MKRKCVRGSRRTTPSDANWGEELSEAKLELSSGMVMEGATLVVVRPVQSRPEVEDDDWLLAAEAFGNETVYAEAMERLLKSRNYIVEMNSF